ncbi:hypothetical protein D9M72_370000 [compost metagenome]
MAQESGVQRADEVGGAHQQAARLFAEGRDDLQELIGDALQRRRRFAGPLGCDLFHLVDEHHGMFQLGDFQEGFTEGAGEALRIGREPGREYFHERPFEPGRDRLRKRGLAGAGRAEEDDGARRHHAEFVRQVRLGQGKHQPAFQQFFLVAHAGNVFPEVAGEDAAAEQAQGLELLALHGDGAFEVAKVLLEDEAAAQEGLHPGFRLRHQRGQFVQPVRCHPVLDGGQQRGADPAAAVFGEGGQEDDPALVVRGASDGGAHHHIALHCHYGVVLFAGCQDLGERIDGLHVGGLERFPEVQDAVKVGRMEIPDPPGGHERFSCGGSSLSQRELLR